MALGTDRPLSLFSAPLKNGCKSTREFYSQHPPFYQWDMLAGPAPHLFGPAFDTNPLMYVEGGIRWENVTVFCISMAEAFSKEPSPL